jgi:Putative zinc-finger
MKLDCKHVWEHISEYIDGTVDAKLREDIELHLEHCEICSAILDSTRNILILTADDRTFELPVGYSKRLHERLKEEIEKSKQEPRAGEPE